MNTDTVQIRLMNPFMKKKEEITIWQFDREKGVFVNLTDILISSPLDKTQVLCYNRYR